MNNPTIASVFRNDEGKYSIQVYDHVLPSKPLPDEISIKEKAILEDLAFAINNMQPVLSEGFSLEELPIEYNLVAMLDNFHRGMEWINMEDFFYSNINQDPVFQLNKSDLQHQKVFSPVTKFFDKISVSWQSITPIGEIDEEALNDEATIPTLALMRLYYTVLSPIEKIALNNLWMNTDENALFCFSLLYECCSIEEFSEGIIHMAALKSEITIEDQAISFNRVLSHTQKVMKWVERNKTNH